MTRSTTRRSGLVSVAAGVLLLGAGAPATAGVEGGGGESTENGYRAVAVSVSGDVSATARARVPLPPALCWWEPWSQGGAVDPDDAEDVKRYWNEELRPWLIGSGAAGVLHVASEQEFDAAIEADKVGDGVTWYGLQWRSDLPTDGTQTQVMLDNGCTFANERRYEGMEVLVSMRWFPFRQPPEPRVDPETLAEYAYDVMNLQEPTLDWNPRIGSRGNAALLNLPTWVWVDESGAVGDKEVVATAGDVTVRVTAQANGLSVSSPAGATQCSTAQARRSYGPEVPAASGCLLDFTRASYGFDQGFPVRATAAWRAEWTSNVGESGTLPGRTVGAVTSIPVVGSQALVTAVD